MDAETLREYEARLERLQEGREKREARFLLDILAHPERLEKKEEVIRTLRDEYEDEKLSRILAMSFTRHAIETALERRVREILGTQAKERVNEEDARLRAVAEREAQRAAKKLPREVMLHELHPMEALWLEDGTALTSLPELVDYLKTHRYEERDWVHVRSLILKWLLEAFHAEDLARRLEKASQEEAQRVLEEEIVRLIDTAVERTRKRYERLAALHEALVKQGREEKEDISHMVEEPPYTTYPLKKKGEEKEEKRGETRLHQEREQRKGETSEEKSKEHGEESMKEKEEKKRRKEEKRGEEREAIVRGERERRTSALKGGGEEALPIQIPGLGEEEGGEEKREVLAHADPFSSETSLPALPRALKRLLQEEEKTRLGKEETIPPPTRVVETHGKGNEQTEKAKRGKGGFPVGREEQAQPTLPAPVEPTRTREVGTREALPGIGEESSWKEMISTLLKELEAREEALRRLEQEVEEKYYALLAKKYADKHEEKGEEKEEVFDEAFTPPTTPTQPVLPSPLPLGGQDQSLSTPDTFQSAEEAPPKRMEEWSSEQEVTLTLGEDEEKSEEEREASEDMLSLLPATLPREEKKALQDVFTSLARAVEENKLREAITLLRKAKRIVKRLARERKDETLRLLLYELETLEIDLKLHTLGVSST